MDKRDPIDALSDMVEDFSIYVKGAEVEHRESIRYRLNLLWVHAFFALLIAPLFALSTLAGGSFAVMRAIPGAPHTLAAFLLVGGMVLGYGCVFRRKMVEIVGLILLAIWYAILALSFLAAIVVYFMDGALAAFPPTYYAPVLYLHLSTIMAVHMSTLARRLRADKEHPWTSPWMDF